ncbi:MAG TPA: hypothetical protein VGD33_08300, partial [Chitinophagaceae bacterium]
MKKLLPLSFLLLLFSYLGAQVPQQVNYQGVARNSLGNIIANHEITLRLTIRDNNPNGTISYRETRKLKTNNFGLFVTAIGSAGAMDVTGSMATVNWSSGTKFLQVEIDPAAGSAFVDMGTSQLLSVPYS